VAERSSLVRLQDEYDVSIDWRGYELHPDTPAGGMLLADKFGAARLKPMQERLQAFAHAFGITDMKLRDRSPNTRKALAVAELAREQGRLEAFRNLAMDAHWRRGMDLESDADLRTLAVEAGLDPVAAVAAATDEIYLDRIDQRRAEANGRGVTGIPTFVIGDQGVVGCQPYETLEAFVKSAGAQRRIKP
jgi:predicted DsbA family dithiol-disulfide isomerase